MQNEEIKDQIYIIADKSLKAHKNCTFLQTGLKPVLQTVYFCHDCNPNLNESYCEDCVENCHSGHHLTTAKKLMAFCYCGKSLHQTKDIKLNPKVRECTFWEFDKIIKNHYTHICKKCTDKRLCSFCVFFCHRHHLEEELITKLETRELKEVECNCDNTCHTDDRYLYFYMKRYSEFRLIHQFNTHMFNMIFESDATAKKLFHKYHEKIKSYASQIEQTGHFSWDLEDTYSGSYFSRSVLTMFLACRSVNLNYFSHVRDEMIPVRPVLEIILSIGPSDEKYDVRVIKKNLLFLLFKLQISKDFERYAKYTTKDYPNISTIQRLELYNSVRNDPELKDKYFNDNYNFKWATLSCLEKYANQCKIDDHLSMALFSTSLNIVKFLMHYGVYNSIQIRQVNEILALLFSGLKLEKTPKNNEEYKESIFKKLPSLLFIMIFAYNDYIFLENLLYKYVNMKEFCVGRSEFGSKVLSSIFHSNIRYLLRYLESKRFDKIILLTFRSLAILGSERDFFLNNLFKIDRAELVDFIMYYDMNNDVYYNNNFPFIIRRDDYASGDIFFDKKFEINIRNNSLAEFTKNLLTEKDEIEENYLNYFIFRVGIHDVIRVVGQKIDKFFEKVKTSKNPKELMGDMNMKGNMVEMISIVKSKDPVKNYNIKLDQFMNDFLTTDIQLALNKTNFHMSVVKILRITHYYKGLTEESFDQILDLLYFYANDNISNSITVLSSPILKNMMLYTTKFPSSIYKFIHTHLYYIHNKGVYLNSYNYIYDCVKNTFANGRFYNSKAEDSDKYLSGFIYNLKILMLIKEKAPKLLLSDMRGKINNFVEKLNLMDSGFKEFFWILNIKKKLLLKDQDYQNYINFDEFLEEAEKKKPELDQAEISKMKSSAAAKLKKQQRDIKKKIRIKNIKDAVSKEKSRTYTKSKNLEDTLNINNEDSFEKIDPNVLTIDKNINDNELMDEPSQNTELTILEDDIVKKNEISDNNASDNSEDLTKNLDKVVRGGGDNVNINKGNPNDKKKMEDGFYLENVKNIGEGQDNRLNVINEKNFDENSMINIDNDLHQQLGDDEMNLTGNEGILTPIDKTRAKDGFDASYIENESAVGHIFDQSVSYNEQTINVHTMKAANKRKYNPEDFDPNEVFKNMELENSDDENLLLEKEFINELGDISNDLFARDNQKANNNKRSKVNKEIIKLKKLRAKEQQNEVLSKIMQSELSEKAFYVLVKLVNIFSEDVINEEFQKTIKKFLPRGDIISILEQKRYITDLKLRSQMIKLLRINYLNTPLSESKSYFDLFYMNEYEFFIKLYERTNSKNISRVSRIMINEFRNLVEIVQSSLSVAEFKRNKGLEAKNMNPEDIEEKLRKNLKIYLIDGLLSTLRVFADKIYSHGQEMTGEEIFNIFEVTYCFMESRIFIEKLLQDESVNDAIAAQRETEDNDLKEIFDDKLGGMDNFNRKNIFKILYTNLNKTIEIALPFYKRHVGDIWFSLDRRVNQVSSQDGINFMPDVVLENQGNIKQEPQILLLYHEFSNICKFYLSQSKNFRQSPIMSIFNSITHEQDFNYRENFFRLFLLVFTNEKFRDLEDNFMLELMNKCLEYDYEKLHYSIYKIFTEKESLSYISNLGDNAEKTNNIRFLPNLSNNNITEANNNTKNNALKKKGIINNYYRLDIFLNEYNKYMLYNIIVLFLYINRQDSFFIWEESNYKVFSMIKFITLLAKNPSNKLHDFILKTSHKLHTMEYNFFFLIEALNNKIIKLTKWGKRYDLRNEIFYDNLFVIYHQSANCLAQYAKEADEQGALLVYNRFKSYIYGLKKILLQKIQEENIHDRKIHNHSFDVSYEVKDSVLQTLICILEEGKAKDLVSDIVYYFEPYKLFKMCVFHFRLILNRLLKKINHPITTKIEHKKDCEEIELNMEIHLPMLLDLYRTDEEFSSSIMLTICNKTFHYLCLLRDLYKNSGAIKCFYLIKSWKSLRSIINSTDNKEITDQTIYGYKSLNNFKYFHDAKTQVDHFLESSEVKETDYTVYKFLKHTFCTIEVFTYRNKIEHVYFPRIPLSYYLSNETINNFVNLGSINRETHFDKAHNLVQFTNKALEETYFHYHLASSVGFLANMSLKMNFSYAIYISFLLSVIVCIANWAHLNDLKLGEETSSSAKSIVSGLNAVNLVYVLFVIVFYSAFRIYPNYRTMLSSHITSSSSSNPKNDINIKMYSNDLNIRTSKTYILNDDASVPLHKRFGILVFGCGLFDRQFLTLFSTFLFIIISLISDKSTYRFFQLSTILLINDLLFLYLRTFITAVRTHLKFFVWLIVLMVIILTTTSALAFDYYTHYKINSNYVTIEETASLTMKSICRESFSKCVFYFVFFGMHYDNGISEIINNDFTNYTIDSSTMSQDEINAYEANGTAGGRFKRVILDVGFQFFMKGIIYSLLLAIVIILYWEMSKLLKKKYFDNENICYICHLTRDDFLKWKLNFDKHKRKQHYWLNYVYFVMYVLTKNSSSLSLKEKSVLEKFRIHDYTWLPCYNCLDMQLEREREFRELEKEREHKEKIESIYKIGRKASDNYDNYNTMVYNLRNNLNI